MQSTPDAEDVPPLATASKQLVRRIFIICENRLQLLLVEAQEERERLFSALVMVLVAFAFSLLAGVALTILVAVAFWDHSPVMALSILTAIYSAVAILFYVKFLQFQRDWQTLTATLDQIKKDRECLEKRLS